MRIVHVSPSYAPCIGGSERMLQAVSERLVARGHAVTVLTLDCATQRELLGNEFDYALSRPSGLGIILPLFRLKADVVGTVNWGFGVVFWVCHSLRLPRVLHVAIPVLHVDRPWAQRKLYPRLFKTCTTAIVLTDAEQEFVRAKGVPSAVVAGGGVEPSRFQQRDGAAVKARYNLGNRQVVGFIGRQDSLKGVPTLVEAMRIVWQNAPETVLLIAGPRSHRDRATATSCTPSRNRSASACCSSMTSPTGRAHRSSRPVTCSHSLRSKKPSGWFCWRPGCVGSR